jgi:hypothetical protein
VKAALTAAAMGALGAGALAAAATMDQLDVTRLDDRTFRLAGAGWAGAVDAGVMVVAEDDGGYADPSAVFVGGVEA